MNLSEEFWDNRYKSKSIGWDLGMISPPLKTYFNQLTNKDIKILIPGGGNSYEAEFLFVNGFKNVFVVDVSKTALKNIKNRIPSFPSEQLIHGDFFVMNTTFDLIVEQTFFCALDPILRSEYATKMAQLLNSKGTLIGVLFKVPLNSDHPPFGGNENEYRSNFKTLFNIELMENCFNSIEDRKDKELFIKLVKK